MRFVDMTQETFLQGEKRDIRLGSLVSSNLNEFKASIENESAEIWKQVRKFQSNTIKSLNILT
jgi:hypothetical protein